MLNLEGNQRIAIQTYKALGRAIFAEGNRCFVLFFPKNNSKNDLLQILTKFEAIQRHVDEDELTSKALLKKVFFL